MIMINISYARYPWIANIYLYLISFYATEFNDPAMLMIFITLKAYKLLLYVNGLMQDDNIML